MDFYAKHPDETLIIVTADHETGGMSWGGNATKYSTYFSKLSQQKYSMDLIADSLAVLPVAEQMKFAQRATGLSLEAEFFTNKNAQNKAHFMVDSLDRAAGIGWTSGAHTGIPVGTYALGVGAEKYNGRIDNTDIIKFVFQLLAINFK
jgi:alkaline phosphatase